MLISVLVMFIPYCVAVHIDNDNAKTEITIMNKHNLD